jgi:hypothetical protein
MNLFVLAREYQERISAFEHTAHCARMWNWRKQYDPPTQKARLEAFVAELQRKALHKISPLKPTALPSDNTGKGNEERPTTN